jgi:antitoxin PrlF
MARTTLRDKGQLTLPREIRDALHVDPGDEIVFEVIGEDTVVVRGMKMIPADQAWFWTESWLAGEREASEDITAGSVDAFDGAEDMFKALHG